MVKKLNKLRCFCTSIRHSRDSTRHSRDSTRHSRDSTRHSRESGNPGFIKSGPPLSRGRRCVGWSLAFAGMTLLFFSTLTFAANTKILNVYNWANFMPPDVLTQFQKTSGIRVNYLEYDSDETLYAKLKADPKSGFDVVVPTNYYVQRMWQEGMLQPLDKSQIPNLRYINPLLLNKEYDPSNRYSVPYLWGTTGIVVNALYHDPKKITQWSDLWKPEYHNQLLMLDDMREVFGVALLDLGYSYNDKNPEHIQQAYQRLRELLPNIKLFNSDAEITIYIDEDATLGIGWNGDVHLAQQENSHVEFIYPKGPFPLWIDCAVIPKNAPHYQNALKFINFISQPEIAKEIALYNGYTSPNMAAVKLMPKSWQENTVLNPPKSVLARAEVEADLGPADALYEKYWQLLKLG